jgi:preprotein translocase subunit SecA
MIEVKEGCPVTGQRETLARITYQQLYRRYLRLGGMTGTAREVAREVASTYGLHTVRIPTRLPTRRRDLGTRIFATAEAKWQAIAARTAQLRSTGRPLLIGTQSVASSERLSALLTAMAVPHQLLNARQDAREAEVISHAGGPGRVTVATQMAGRGTDISLGAGVAEQDGLHVVVAERAEARRIDRQLVGRCARHGEPGSFERFESAEEEIVRNELPAGSGAALQRALRAGVPGAWIARGFIALAQRVAETRAARARRALSRAEEALERSLAFAGRGE